MSDFAKSLGKALGRPSLLKIPAPILRLILGNGAEVVLQGQKVLSKKLEKFGFDFSFSELNEALQFAIKK